MSLDPRFEVVPLTEVPSNDCSLLSEPHRPVILVVDDEHVIADSLTAVLRRSGFAAIAAYDGHSALELATVIPPELVITDVAMPRMNGIQLALTLVNTIADCKVLLFSGHASHMELIEANEAGFRFPLLAKPVHPALMLAHIAESLKSPRLPPSRLLN
jgi:DNA-binding response OmpR family regulator